ncbi:MAG: hypothetical protein R3D02_07250 [Hyphomicrobiales bacterium]
MPLKGPQAVEIADRVHWIGARPQSADLRPHPETANGTTYNAYVVRGSDGVAVVDTVKEEFSADFFERLEQWRATTRSGRSCSTISSPIIPARCPS